MSRLISTGKCVVITAALWAVGVSLYILFSPISVQVVAVRRVFGIPTDIIEPITREQSWYEAQGLWGVCVLAIFSGLYLLALRFAWRGHYTAVALLSTIAMGLCIVAGFSIGGAYLPAASTLMVGAVLLLSSRKLG